MTQEPKRRVIAAVPPGHERVRLRQRAYLTGGQRKLAAQLFGCVRVVQNDALAYAAAEHKAGRPYPATKVIQHHVLTLGKQTPQRAWLNDVCGVALIQAVADVDRAYRNFFNSITGKRKGPQVGFPKRRKRSAAASARFAKSARFVVTPDPADADWARVRLSKIGQVKFRLTQPLEYLADATSVTLIREADGRFYVSFVVVRPLPTRHQPQGRGTGIDPGLASFATTLTIHTNTGEETTTKIATPAYMRRKARALARSQRSLSRKQRGSANRRKARQKVAVVHRKVRQARLDHAHQQAAKIVAATDFIAIETLNVKGMARGTNAKSVHDQAMSQFLTVLTEKAARHHIPLVKVGRWFPSTQLCSTCGAQTGPKGQEQLNVRTWTCSECSTRHDRDINAARNILTEGLRLHTLESQSTQNTPVADGQSETQNASPEGHSDARTVGRTPRNTATKRTEAGSPTGEPDHAAA